MGGGVPYTLWGVSFSWVPTLCLYTHNNNLHSLSLGFSAIWGSYTLWRLAVSRALCSLSLLRLFGSLTLFWESHSLGGISHFGASHSLGSYALWGITLSGGSFVLLGPHTLWGFMCSLRIYTLWDITLSGALAHFWCLAFFMVLHSQGEPYTVWRPSHRGFTFFGSSHSLVPCTFWGTYIHTR